MRSGERAVVIVAPGGMCGLIDRVWRHSLLVFPYGFVMVWEIDIALYIDACIF